ncbi:TlpA disulfide reductase family protein [Mucilaginibacter sp. KACC 22773]|uniref:TlpA family protein disulfide reductase n=1 Tax=Mucilaginibacter sp. KACC 22773 TaxID=3025671 RepID=UPI0023668A07|nr:TlpA disulfide reductase family protein [Mucilaginibacter sp. KACC 22773]WDF77073.1 TlpA disulfide reductase family protein [Mucilaginibacter sp. KACC 22773]
MKPILYLIFTIALMLSQVGAFSQTGGVTISGYVDTSITGHYLNNELSIKINQTSTNFDQGVIVKVPVNSDGTFKCNIPSLEKYLYLSFWILNKNDKIHQLKNLLPIHFPTRSLSKLQEVYLFQKGDSVDLDIRQGGYLTFKGKGSAKLNCQFQIHSIDPIPQIVALRASQLPGRKQMYLEDAAYGLTEKMRLQILNSYKPEMTDTVYRVLYTDILSLSEYQILDGLYILSYTPPIESNAVVVQKYMQYNIRKPQYTAIDTNYQIASAYYADMIFVKEFNMCRLYSKKGEFMRGDSFKEVYNRIKFGYKGPLRDKLLFICFQKLNKFYSTEARSFLADALKIMGNNKYKTLLRDWGNHLFIAYPFELQDAVGNIHKLSDYKGKVIVMDFWSTGCVPCMQLSAAMHSVMEEYKNRNDVIFITVSVDKNKLRWMKSLISGHYTSQNSVNLYTNGNGNNDPAFLYYNFFGVPQQLIIGKNGEIISSSPPRSDLDNISQTPLLYKIDSKTSILEPNYELTIANPNTKAFMKLINQAL